MPTTITPSDLTVTISTSITLNGQTINSENILTIKDVSMGYGGAPVIAGINLDVREGEFFGLIGLNDMEMSRWQNIGLTTIRQPVADIIEAAIDLVVATIENPARPAETRLFPCPVIERRTLRALP